MAVRITEADVEAVLGITVAVGHLDPFITDASLWVDNYLVGACTALNADKLPAIEKYIAAHFYTLSTEGSTGQLISATRRGVSERYAERKGDEAGISPFIRTAAAFDPCGIIAQHFLGKHRLVWRVSAGYRAETGAP